MMFYFSIALLILGAVLLFVEALIPGFGIFGISGIVLVVISATVTLIYFPFFVLVGEVIVVGFLAYILFKYAKKKQLTGKLILTDTLNFEENEIGGLDYFMGKEGITKTPLRPFGTVDFNGSLVEVYSDGNFIPEKNRVKVISTTNNKIVVSKIDSLQN